MQGDEVLGFGLFAAMVMGLAVTVSSYKLRVRRLGVVEDALKRGNLDPGTQQLLAQELGRPLFDLAWLRRWCHPSKIAFAVGWMVLLVGVGLWLAGDYYAAQAGPPVTLGGFGLLSLPLMIRELDRRQPERVG